MGAREVGFGELAGVIKALGRSWDIVLRGKEEGGGGFGYRDRCEAGREGSDVLNRPTFCERRRRVY